MTVRTSQQLINMWGDTDPFDYNVDLIDSFNIGRMGEVGSLFYVDPGVVSGDGQSPETAFGTMQEGVDATTGGVGDVIIRMPGNEEVAAPILFNKRGIRVYASNFGASVPDGSEDMHGTWAAAGFADGPVGIISEPCGIYGQTFASRNLVDAVLNAAAGSSAALAIADTVNFVDIAGCRFPRWWATVYAIKVVGSSYNSIRGNTFEGLFTTTVGVESGPINNPTYNRLSWNRFIGCGTCFNVGAGTGSDGNLLEFNSAIDCTLFLDLNAQNSDPDSLAFSNWLGFVNNNASFDVANIGALQALGWYYVGNNYLEV